MYPIRWTGLCAALLLTGPSFAQVLEVPQQYSTISAALAAAPAGASIFVSAGTYNEQLTWPNRDGIRLIGLAGPAQTIVDAKGAGRALTMSGALSSRTIVEGFTFQGGALSGSSNYGAGLYLRASGGPMTPLLRFLIIKDHTSDGTRNYGGGLHVTGSGARPRVEFSLFENNELKNGSWNYGAGVYVDSAASIELVACRLENNRTSGGDRGYGGGFYHSASGPASLIASCQFIANVLQSNIWNYGAGARLTGNNGALLLNNTFVGNRCVGGSIYYGGNLEVSNRNTPSIVANNIFVQGDCPRGGGIAMSSSTYLKPQLLSNLFFQNQGGDSYNLSKGPTDLTADPLFAPNSYKLLPASPCVDAGTWLPSFAGIRQDQDRQPRRMDGNFDGLAGDGARIDIGADEYGIAELGFSGPPQVGAIRTLSVKGRSGDLYALFMDFARGELFLEPFGEFLLTPTALLLGGGTTPALSPFFVPNDPSFRGLRVHLQALLLGTGSNVTGAWSNPLEGSIR
jgi:hypothetical protein